MTSTENGIANPQGVEPQWQLRVKTLFDSGSEREFAITVSSNDTVGEFRIKLASESNVEPRKQRLIFSGRVLANDTQKLADAGIENGSALHMVVRPDNVQTASSADGPAGQRDSNPARNQQGPTTGATAQSMNSIFEIPPFNLLGAGGIILANGQGPILTTQPGSAASDQPSGRARGRNMRTVTQTRRDFGSDDGGTWYAYNAARDAFRVDREITGSGLLTEEEYNNNRVSGPDPVMANLSSRRIAPVPGFDWPRRPSQADSPSSSSNAPNRESSSARVNSRERVVPNSRSSANELIYDLFENVLPAIRQIPGYENFRFSRRGASDSTPYIAQSSDNQFDSVATAVSDLGESFVTLGQALQSIGDGWRNRNSSNANNSSENSESANADTSNGQIGTEAGINAVVNTMRHIASTAPLAVPFLESARRQEQPESSSSPAGNNTTDSNAQGPDISTQPSDEAQRDSYVNRPHAHTLWQMQNRSHRQHYVQEMYSPEAAEQSNFSIRRMNIGNRERGGSTLSIPQHVDPIASHFGGAHATDRGDQQRGEGGQGDGAHREFPIPGLGNAGTVQITISEVDIMPGGLRNILQSMHNQNGAQQQSQPDGVRAPGSGGASNTNATATTGNNSNGSQTQAPGSVNGNLFSDLLNRLVLAGNEAQNRNAPSSTATATQTTASSVSNGGTSDRNHQMHGIHGVQVISPDRVEVAGGRTNPFPFASLFLGTEVGRDAAGRTPANGTSTARSNGTQPARQASNGTSSFVSSARNILLGPVTVLGGVPVPRQTPLASNMSRSWNTMLHAIRSSSGTAMGSPSTSTSSRGEAEPTASQSASAPTQEQASTETEAGPSAADAADDAQPSTPRTGSTRTRSPSSPQRPDGSAGANESEDSSTKRRRVGQVSMPEQE